MAGEIERNIEFLNEGIDFPEIPLERVMLWINKIIESRGYKTGDICYIYCNDSKILEVNQQYLQHDYYTDIITFDYCENNVVSGDLFISLDTVKSNSDTLKTNYHEELLRVMIHGILHLCGLKDKSEKEALEMRSAENDALVIYNAF